MHFTILIRGGWSIGKVLSTYFQLADDGDRQLANLLAGRQYLTKDFSRLVPHFTTNVTKQVIRSVFVGEYIRNNFDKLEDQLSNYKNLLVGPGTSNDNWSNKSFLYFCLKLFIITTVLSGILHLV